LPIGSRFTGDDGSFSGEVIGRDEAGLTHVHFAVPDGRSVTEIANRIGRVPLPPYIRRPPIPTRSPGPTARPARHLNPPTGSAIRRFTPIATGRSPWLHRPPDFISRRSCSPPWPAAV
jgi:hypothetical protein